MIANNNGNMQQLDHYEEKLPYCNWFTDDYLAAIAQMNEREALVYTKLLAHGWSNRGWIPNDMDRLLAVCLTLDGEGNVVPRDKMEPVIRRIVAWKYRPHPDGAAPRTWGAVAIAGATVVCEPGVERLINPRQWADWSKAQGVAGDRTARAKAGAQARWSKAREQSAPPQAAPPVGQNCARPSNATSNAQASRASSGPGAPIHIVPPRTGARSDKTAPVAPADVPPVGQNRAREMHKQCLSNAQASPKHCPPAPDPAPDPKKDPNPPLPPPTYAGASAGGEKTRCGKEGEDKTGPDPAGDALGATGGASPTPLSVRRRRPRGMSIARYIQELMIEDGTISPDAERVA